MAAGYTILFLDVSGFQLLPTVVRTWAPIGQTPILKAKISRSKYNTIAAMTTDGRMFTYLDKKSFHSEGVIRFLRHMLSLLPGKVLLIWDNASTHTSHEMQSFLEQPDIRRRLMTLHLPPYAPDLNPVELVWHYLKYVLLKNRVFRNLRELKVALQRAILWVKRRPELLRQFVRHIHLYSVQDTFLSSL